MSFGINSVTSPALGLGGLMSFMSGTNMASFIGTSTWAARPSSASVGDIILISDVGAAPGSHMTWTGSVWRPIAPVIFYNQFTEVTKTDANTNFQTIASFVMPAGLMSPGMSLTGWIIVSGPGNRDVRVTWGGVVLLGQVIPSGSVDFRGLIDIMAISSGVACGWNPGGAGVVGQQSAAYTSGAVDHSIAQTVNIEMRYNTAGAGSQTITARPFKLMLVP